MNVMKFLGSAVQVGFVCLTAVSTLIAGVPHFDCICPNGTHKAFCLGSASPRTGGCCCGGSCCSSSAGGSCQAQDSSPAPQGDQACCCKSQPQPSSEAPATGSQVKGSCCTKTLAEGQLLTVSPTTTGAHQNLTDNFSTPLPQPASRYPALVVGQSLFAWHRCDLPPPPDLVLTLQHFLI